MGVEKFGGLLEAFPERESSKRGRGVKELPHTSDTKDEDKRLRGKRREFATAEDVLDISDVTGLAETPEERLLLKEAIEQALDPRNKNKQVRRLMEEDLMGLKRHLSGEAVSGRKPKDAFDARAMEVHSGRVKTGEAESTRRATEARKAAARTAELRRRSRGGKY